MNEQAQPTTTSERALRVVAGAWLLALLIFVAALATLSGWVGVGMPFVAWSPLAFGLLIASRRYFDLAPRRAKLLAALTALLWVLLLYGTLYGGEAIGHGVGFILRLLLVGFPVAFTAIAVRCIQQRSVQRAI
jgi:hypothetical protein